MSVNVGSTIHAGSVPLAQWKQITAMLRKLLRRLVPRHISRNICFFVCCSICCRVELRISFSSAWNSCSAILEFRNRRSAFSDSRSLPWEANHLGLSGKKQECNSLYCWSDEEYRERDSIGILVRDLVCSKVRGGRLL